MRSRSEEDTKTKVTESCRKMSVCEKSKNRQLLTCKGEFFKREEYIPNREITVVL